MPERISRTVLGVPRQIWERHQRWIMVAALLILVGAGVLLYFLQSFWPWGVALWALVIGLHIARWLNSNRLSRNLQAVSYEVCIVCGYSLKNLPSLHVCPECGHSFDKDNLKRQWEHSIAFGREPSDLRERKKK